jgi:hypothetical protein
MPAVNEAKPSPCMNSIFSATLFRAAFCLAVSSDSGEMSRAVIFAFGDFAARAMAMQPLPVPKSKTVESSELRVERKRRSAQLFSSQL